MKSPVINGKEMQTWSFRETGNLFPTIYRKKIFALECCCSYPGGYDERYRSGKKTVHTTLGLCDICGWTPWVVVAQKRGGRYVAAGDMAEKIRRQ